MNSAQLSVRCRCGHARRQHNTGTIFEGYRTGCYIGHNEPCLYFEPAEGWQEDFAAMLRAEGYIVERVTRDERGRFRRLIEAPTP